MLIFLLFVCLFIYLFEVCNKGWKTMNTLHQYYQFLNQTRVIYFCKVDWINKQKAFDQVDIFFKFIRAVFRGWVILYNYICVMADGDSGSSAGAQLVFSPTPRSCHSAGTQSRWRRVVVINVQLVPSSRPCDNCSTCRAVCYSHLVLI